MGRRLGRIGAMGLVLVMTVVGLAWAADDAAVKGSVVDPTGARVGGARVTLLGASGATDAVADAMGDFAFDGVAPGRYQLQASAPGFQVRTTDAMFVAAGSLLTIEIALPLGPLEQSVSVTAAATDVLPSQIGAPVTILDSTTLGQLGKPEVLEALRLVPGASLVQTGARGGTAAVFIRGGNANFNKLLIDGIPANDIGGGADLAQFSTEGVERIEVLRDANSVVFGSDALAGVVSVTTRRGSTAVPLGTIALDGGNLGSHHEGASLGGTAHRLDYFAEFGNMGTDNELPNNKYRSKTAAGRVGLAIGHSTDVSATLRWIDRRFESPNAMGVYGVPDDAFQTNRSHVIGVAAQTQITDRWQSDVRVGLSDQKQRFENPTLSGENIFGVGFGRTMTLTGANGYSVTGRGALDYGAFSSSSRAARQGLYGQTTYQVTPELALSGGGNVEREQGYTNPDADPTVTRHNAALWAEGRATVMHRVSVTAGLGYAHNSVFKSAYTPRVSVAAYLRTATATGFWGDTRLTFNAGKGIKAPSVYQAQNSLNALLLKTAAGTALADSAGIGPVGPERGRNLDLGIEQGLWQGRARVRVSYFDNEFSNLLDYVSKNVLPRFGISPEVAALAGFGAYVNSQSFTTKGAEFSGDAVFGRVRFAGSYTYLDARVTQSLADSAISPEFNPAFPGIPIGGFGPLTGQRPFRRPAHTGSLLASYTQGPAQVAVSAYFAGRADDSTFQVGSDVNFGNSLLLPNQNLDAGYQKVDASGSYRFGTRVKWFVTVENVLNQRYQPAFGFPALPANVRTGITLSLGGR